MEWPERKLEMGVVKARMNLKKDSLESKVVGQIIAKVSEMSKATAKVLPNG